MDTYKNLKDGDATLEEQLEFLGVIAALAQGARDRIECESNYYAYYSGGKTRRYQIDPDKPIKELIYPEFYDVKLTSYCKGGCEWCVPSGTMISTPDGVIPIENISNKDVVFGSESISEQKIDQLFERDYNGEMIELILDDGKILSLTPEHEVFTINRGWVLAKNLTLEDDIKIINE